MSEKIDDLLEQKDEDQVHSLDNTSSLLAYGEIPSSFFLLTRTISFYARNFLRIFALSSLYFVLIAASFIAQLFYFQNIIVPTITSSLILLLYICTFANLVLEEESSVLIAAKYAIVGLIPVTYSCFIAILIICGFAVFAFIPEFIFLTFFADSFPLKLIGGVIFIILFILVLVWYSLFLFVAVDESKYGFKSLFRSKTYVGVNFPDYLRRLVICITAIPIIFTLMIYILQGFFVTLELFSNFLDTTYNFPNIYHILRDAIDNKLSLRQMDIEDQYEILVGWFVKIVFVIPFLVTYLGFLYSALSCENHLPSEFSGSTLHKVILRFFCVIGFVMILVLMIKFL